MKRNRNRSAIMLLAVMMGGMTAGCGSIAPELAAEPRSTPLPAHRSDERVQLDDAWLFIPAGFSQAADEVELTLHLHGARELVEARFVDAAERGIVANVTLPGLSSVYRKKFGDRQAFPRILEQARAKLVERGLPVKRFKKVTVTSFSAGFGGVRELLKDTESFERIDRLIMADSIYAGYVGDPASRSVDPELMDGFLRFAREAREGRKRLLITHTDLIPDGYASTAETADFLIAGLGGSRELKDETLADGLHLKSRFQAGECEILGFAGSTGEAHMTHLRRLDLWLKRAR